MLRHLETPSDHGRLTEVPRNVRGLAPVHELDPPQRLVTDPHVLRATTVAPGPQLLLKTAREDLGYKERSDGWTKFGDWYGKRHHDNAFAKANWCDMGVSNAAFRCGLGPLVGEYAFTPWHAQWFDDQGRWHTTDPHVGDIVFFNWAGKKGIGNIEHVGIVEAIQAHNVVQTIEYNTADACLRRQRSTGLIVGYGRPDWSALEDDSVFAVVSLGLAA